MLPTSNELFLISDGTLVRRADLPSDTVFVVSRYEDYACGVVTFGLSNGVALNVSSAELVAEKWNSAQSRCLAAGAAIPLSAVLAR